MNKYDQIFNEKLGELMKDVIFPENKIYGNSHGSKFGELVINALKHHNEDTLQCSLDEYERVYTKFIYLSPYQCTMPAMFIALQATMSLTPDKLREFYNDLNYYIQEKRALIEMKREWDAIAAPYIEQAKKYAQSIAQQDIDKEERLRGLKPKKNKIITLS